MSEVFYPIRKTDFLFNVKTKTAGLLQANGKMKAGKPKTNPGQTTVRTASDEPD